MASFHGSCIVSCMVVVLLSPAYAEVATEEFISMKAEVDQIREAMSLHYQWGRPPVALVGANNLVLLKSDVLNLVGYLTEEDNKWDKSVGVLLPRYGTPVDLDKGTNEDAATLQRGFKKLRELYAQRFSWKAPVNPNDIPKPDAIYNILKDNDKERVLDKLRRLKNGLNTYHQPIHEWLEKSFKDGLLASREETAVSAIGALQKMGEGAASSADLLAKIVETDFPENQGLQVAACRALAAIGSKGLEHAERILTKGDVPPYLQALMIAEFFRQRISKHVPRYATLLESMKEDKIKSEHALRALKMIQYEMDPIARMLLELCRQPDSSSTALELFMHGIRDFKSHRKEILDLVQDEKIESAGQMILLLPLLEGNQEELVKAARVRVLKTPESTEELVSALQFWKNGELSSILFDIVNKKMPVRQHSDASVRASAAKTLFTRNEPWGSLRPVVKSFLESEEEELREQGAAILVGSLRKDEELAALLPLSEQWFESWHAEFEKDADRIRKDSLDKAIVRVEDLKKNIEQARKGDANQQRNLGKLYTDLEAAQKSMHVSVSELFMKSKWSSSLPYYAIAAKARITEKLDEARRQLWEAYKYVWSRSDYPEKEKLGEAICECLAALGKPDDKITREVRQVVEAWRNPGQKLKLLRVLVLWDVDTEIHLQVLDDEVERTGYYREGLENIFFLGKKASPLLKVLPRWKEHCCLTDIGLEFQIVEHLLTQK